MSQFKLEPEEDQLLLNAIRAHAMHYEATHNSPETDMLNLAAKIEDQLRVLAEEAEAARLAEEAAAAPAPKAKKSKAVEE
jgi:hypothetical protein